MKQEQAAKEESIFLEGPRARKKELLFAFRVFLEFIKGFRKFHFLGPCATVFGSARFEEGHPYYELAQKTGSELVKLGFTVMTGGGPGLMEAVNRGAKSAGGRSIGCNILLPKEQEANAWLDKWVTIRYFFVRKVLLSKYSYAFIVLPGGYGTLDEFFEALTLIQTHTMKGFPVVLLGTKYHRKLYEYIVHMADEGTIDKDDISIFLITDSIEEAVRHLQTYSIKKFNLSQRKPIRPIGWLGEKS